MEDIASLENRVRVLEEQCQRLTDIEAIRKLRGRYWRCMRERLFDDLVGCYAEEAVVNFGFGIHLQGKEALAKYYNETIAKLHTMIIPQGHNPEIEITGETTATGRWLIDNPQVEASTKTAARLGSTYEEEYLKENGEWKIGRQKVHHIYRELIKMDSPKNVFKTDEPSQV